MITDLFFIQSDIVNSLPCPPQGSSDIVYLISSFLAGGTLSAIANGFFNVEHTKDKLTLEGRLELEKQRNQHLQGEVLERDEMLKRLGEINAQLSEEKTSGFNIRMSDLENMVRRLQADKDKLKAERKELIDRLQKRQPPQ